MNKSHFLGAVGACFLVSTFSVASVSAAPCVVDPRGLNLGGLVMDFETEFAPLNDVYRSFVSTDTVPCIAPAGREFTTNGTLTPEDTVLGEWGLTSPNHTGSQALFNNGDGGTTTFRAGDRFDFMSIDLSELIYEDAYDSPSSVTFFGRIFLTGEIVSQSVTLDGFFGMETFSFDDTFVGVTSVWWNQTAAWHQFDNITVENIYLTSIPIPAAGWLFGSGMLGLFGMARRKKMAGGLHDA